MRRRIQSVFALMCCVAAGQVARAQSAPAQGSSQSKLADSSQQAPAQKPGAQSNPFPEDTSNIPVVPTTMTPAVAPPPALDGNGETTSLLGVDSDPIKSPDDEPSSSGSGGGFSSSLQGTDDVKIPDDEKPGKRQKAPEPTHQESAKQDENVGSYYLAQKNWRAALSRFESAVVLDPENPDVYWGLAEAQRQLGDFANAKANYLKVMDYDPDSKHSKEAKKYLKQPEIANAPDVAKNRPGAQPQQ